MKHFGSLVVAASVVAAEFLAPQAALAASLDIGEQAHLVFMREEEKLARDVYMTFATMYPGKSIFENISGDSEQVHTDIMAQSLAEYGIADPNPDTNNLPQSIGVFTGDWFGWYFDEKFTLLVDMGSASYLSALYVGAFIEELDMMDIVKCPKVIVESPLDIGPDECGLDYTDERALINRYTNLLEGSKSHLRAYVRLIERFIGRGNYEAQVLTPAEVDEILGR